MFQTLSFDEFTRLAQTSPRVVVYKEMAGDHVTPISIFQALAEKTANATLLESATDHDEQGRHSFIGIGPLVEFTAHYQQVTIKRKGQPDQQFSTAEPLAALRQLFAQCRCAANHPTIGFSGGMVGFFSYDAVRLFEQIPARHSAQNQLPDICFKQYEIGVNLDHQASKLIILAIAEVGADLTAAYTQALEKIEAIAQQIFGEAHEPKANDKNTSVKPMPLTVDIPDHEYNALVEQAKQLITAGEIFQVVLSRRFQQKISCSPFNLYRALRFSSPSPYMFYLHDSDYVIVGASPEKLVSVTNGYIETLPIAGTRPRGANAVEDKQLAESLLNDSKELAEHMMLVDLARNDVGRVAVPGTVQVPVLKMVKNFSHVMHIVSVVSGQLLPDKDAFDALKAVFPAGTVSGAPKIRAMEIIDQLETSRRGIYAGAICMIDPQGNFDSCLAIRTILIKDQVATVRTGAGLVFDSDPQTEADETRHKAKGALTAINLAEEGLV